ncbi:GPW/gp25 family protein [Streptomyces sp. WAC06614]|uniref:GPW/gp25 family protein n=1 Tax=Streptomyces sp. WAC06614 TaxID=2487416 RepID=UPI000F76C5EB|nr:GPW/gp25 family protein [Streptomyces sp. WAC06614]RSS67421.1 baseplate protein [Streptomyces sp. WAC06614]
MPLPSLPSSGRAAGSGGPPTADFVGAGWAFPVRTDAQGRIALARGRHEIEQAMYLILATYPGERPMRPHFGCRLRDFVFGDTAGRTRTEMANAVREALLVWEPRIDVESVDVTNEPDRPSLLYIDVQYTVKITNDRRNLVFPFYVIPEEGDY